MTYLTHHGTKGYRRVEGRMSSGLGYSYWIPEVPRIPDQFLRSVVYLYPDRASAEAGEGIGGSGFLADAYANIEGEPAVESYYIVTNQHVAVKAQWARMTDRDGKVHLVETPREGWHDHPDGDDVSAFPLGVLDGRFLFAALDTGSFVHMEAVVRPGDDVFFVGRFISPDGKQGDSPLVRFGHVASLPVKVPTPRQIEQESFIVEALSLKGYSGSPVVVFGMHLAASLGWKRIELKMGPPGPNFSQAVFPPRLLGIDWGHLLHPYRQPVLEAGSPTDWSVQQNAGLAGVVPAWKIQELLHSEELEEMRDKDAAEHRRKSENVSLDVAERDAELNKPSEFERFENLTRKVAQVPKSEVDEKRQTT